MYYNNIYKGIPYILKQRTEMAEYFDVLKSIINKQNVPQDDIEKHFAGFMAVKWLSANPMACYTVNHLNSARGNKFIPKIAEYKFLKETIKLPKNTFLQFDKNDKDMQIILDVLVTEFRVGIENVQDYMKILGGERILKILNKHAQLLNTQTTDPKIIELRKAIKKKEKDLLKIKGY
jgi:hypothetical protein